MQNLKLLNPGPVTLTKRVREAMLSPDLCHREQEFSDLQRDILNRLNRVYPASIKSGFESVLLSGSGTAAVESMIQSLIPESGSLTLVVSNGVYGERMASMLQAQKKNFEIIQSDWCSALDLMEVEKRLIQSKKQGKSITHVLSVHHETTTGRLNDIASLGKLCKEYQVPLLLDTVSSFGGEWIDFENWNLLAVAATSNKCLHGVPGICFVLAQKEALLNSKDQSRSVYLDLYRYYTEQSKSGFSPFTQAVQSLFALQEALKEFEDQGGYEKRHAQYSFLSQYVRKQLKEKGVELLLGNEKDYSVILTSFKMKPGKSYIELHDVLKKNGLIIYAGQGQFNGEIFRVATMGDLHLKDMETLVSFL